jgi:hypothetical protein
LLGRNLLLLALGDQVAHRVTRLRTLANPVADALVIKLEFDGLTAWIVVADDLDKPSVALGSLVGDHDAIKRLLLGTVSCQSDG